MHKESPAPPRNTVPLSPEATPASLLERWRACSRKVARVTVMWLLAVKLLLLAMAVPLMYFWSQWNEQIVKSVQSAGRVVRVSQSTGLMTRALVETDLGFYSLRDGVSLGKGEAVLLQTRGTNRRYLCDTQQRCTALM